MINQIINPQKPILSSVSGKDLEIFQSLAQSFTPQKSDSLTQGIVTNVDEDYIYVTTNSKTEGKIPIAECFLLGHGVVPNIGDSIQVFHTASGNTSFAMGAQIRVWSNLENFCRNLQPVEGVILGKTKKRAGFIVGILPYGARAFLPLSKASPAVAKKPLDKGTDSRPAIKHMFHITKLERRSMHICVSMVQNIESENKIEEVKKNKTQTSR